MAEITFLPAERVVAVKEGKTILDATLDHNVEIGHACGGSCACATCHVVVVEGMDHLSPMREEERARLEKSAEGLTPSSRLACQIRRRTDQPLADLHLWRRRRPHPRVTIRKRDCLTL